MAFWDEVKEKAAWAAEQMSETLEEVKDRTSTEYNIYKLQRQIGAQEEEIETLYSKLGRRAFELVASGKLDDAECKGLGEELQAKKARITDLEGKIEETRKLAAEQRAREEAKAAEAGESGGDDEVDGEAIWEDAPTDDGTPPPP